MKTRYTSAEDYADMDDVGRALLQADALMKCTKFNQDGKDVRIFTFLPTRQVFMKVGDRLSKRYTQEEFHAMRRDNAQRLMDLISAMNGPTRGKGSLLKRRAAAREFAKLAGWIEE